MCPRDESKRTGLLLFSILVSACGTTEPEVSPRVDVQLEPEAVAASSEMMVTITVGNEGNTVLRFQENPCNAVRFEVRDPEGDLVYPLGGEPRCAVLGPTQLTIQPGSELSVTHRWAAIEGYGTTGGSGEPLAPGLYQVTPVVELETGNVEGDAAFLEVTS